MPILVLPAVAALLVTHGGIGQNNGGATRLLTVFGGQSYEILGSEDVRQAWGMGIQWVRSERALRFKGFMADLVMEGYFLDSTSKGASQMPPNRTLAFGGLAMARYKWPVKNDVRGYLEIGWGLQYTPETSVDLDSNINSTPVLGFGASIQRSGHEFLVGLRYLHISNAGIRGNNQGQNGLNLLFGMSF